jgi:hypothetical protein
MKSFIIRAAAFIAAAAISFTAVSCSSEKKNEENAGTHQEHNMAAVNADDGDYSDYAERELKPENSDVPIFITFRATFAEDEEAAKVAEFYYAISEKNAEYLEKSVQPDVLKYELNGAGSQEYLDTEYDYIKENLIGSDFKFTAVTIDDDVSSDDNISYYDSLLAKAAPDLKATVKKVFKVNCLYDKGDGGQLSLTARLSENNMDEIQIAVYTIDGKPYIIF